MRDVLLSILLVLFVLTAPTAVLADGELDLNFGSSGFVLLDLSIVLADSALGDLVVQPDGKIVIVGSGQVSFVDWDFSIARLRPDGVLDSTFNGGVVRVLFDLGGDNVDLATHVSLRPSGSVLIGGTAEDASDRYLAFAQLTPEGLMDGVFNGQGTFAHATGSDFILGISDLEGERADQVLRVLTWDELEGDRLEIEVLHGGGQPLAISQQTFDSEYTKALGLAEPHPPDDSFDYQVGSQLGTQPTGPDLLIIRELRFLGKPDQSYGDGGSLLVRASSAGGEWASEGRVIRSYPGDRIVAAGHAWRTNGTDGFMTRRLQDGSPDPSFGTDGQQYVAWNFGGDLHDRVVNMAVQRDGNMVFGATSEIAVGVEVPVIARLDRGGAYDPAFAGVGWRRLPDPPGYVLRGEPRIALTADEDLIVACLAESTGGGTSRIYVTRLQSSHFIFGDGFESGDTSAW